MLIGIMCRVAGKGKLRPPTRLLAGLAAAICPMAAGAQSIDARQIAACTRIADTTTRLACYDQAAGRKLPTPSAPSSVVTAATAAQGTDSVPTATAALPVAAATDRPTLRLALGGGFGVGDYYALYNRIGHGGYAVSNSGPGNSGALTSAQVWLDHWIAPDWSVGLELQTLNSRGRMKVVLPGGLAILTENLRTGLSANVTAQQITANVAWHPETSGALQPWIAGGLVVGHAHASADYFIENPFLGQIAQGTAISLFYPGFKLTTGMDYTFSHNYYVSLQPGVLIVTGQPLGLPQRYINFGLSLMFGRAF